MWTQGKLAGEVLVCYSDIWYEAGVAENLLYSDKDIAVGVDLGWKGVQTILRNQRAYEAETET